MSRCRPSVCLVTALAFVLPAASFAASPVPTSTLLTTSANGSYVTKASHGTAITLTAQVQSPSAPITVGQVQFCDASAAHCTDLNLLGTAQLTSAGTATFKFVPGIGAHSYRAQFLGVAGQFQPSNSSTQNLTINGTFPTTTTLDVSGSNGTYTFTSTVTATGSTIAPSGFVDLENLAASNPNYEYLTQAPTGPATPGLSVVNGPIIPSGTTTGGLYTQAVGVADFNGDGIKDLVGDGSNFTIQTLLGKGNGTFTSGPSNSSGFGPDHIVVADFNGDGFMDFAGINYAMSSVVVYLGNGDGSFQSAITTAGITNPNSLVVGDFNHDGIPDLATTNNGHSFISVYLGTGTGTFVRHSVALPAASDALVATDVNGDGNLDLVASLEDSLQLVLGSGNGTFKLGASLPVPDSPELLLVGDFNNDGLPDLVCNSVTQGGLYLLENTGSGNFAAPVAIGGGGFNITLTDLNHDGNEDIALGSGASEDTPATFGVLFGNGQGGFTETTFPLTGRYFENVNASFLASADFNDDGNYDLALGDPGDAKVIFAAPTETVQAIIPNYTLPSGSYLIQAVSLFPQTYAGSSSPSVSLQGQP